MTVRELIEKLQKCPPDLEVETEGCDCMGDVAAVYMPEADPFDGTQTYRKVILARYEEDWTGMSKV